VSKRTANISVIIPAYNRAGLIGGTLRSLLNQTIPAKEIIVVDDGSTDGTAEAVEHEFSIFSEQFSGNSKSNIPNPTFKILRQANAGPGAARNRGLAEATGEFIHFFDSDDIAAPNKHEVQLKALLETGADIAYGPWVKGRFTPKEAQTVACGELSVASLNYENTSYQSPATTYSGFTPEGPVLQARGLPKGNLVQALLTNWSVVPHACLFRRSILERVGGFPEDIWVGEDQLLFLRCLLAGAKVVHTPGTMVFYRLGDDLGKLTATGVAQKRHARDWGRFLLKANQEVTSGQCRVARKRTCSTTESTESTESTEGAQGNAQGTCAGAAFSNPFTSELARDSENTALTRFASAPASPPVTSRSLLATVPEAPSPATAPTALTPATSYSLPVTHRPSAWFGFRLRTYEVWWDLGNFFPDGESEVKNELQAIWKRNWFSGLRFQLSGFVLRKWGGLMNQIFGHRVKGCFRPGKFTSREATLFDTR
jgi:glycosyltransferase involved in cell wall biosynthesis